MQNPAARAERATLVPRARGRILEVGIGSGLNIRFYGTEVTALTGLDPSGELLRIARRRAARAPFPVTLVAASAEADPVRGRELRKSALRCPLCQDG